MDGTERELRLIRQRTTILLWVLLIPAALLAALVGVWALGQYMDMVR